MATSTSPWAQVTTNVESVDRHYFTLDPSKIPSSNDTQYEYYAWASGPIDLPAGDKLKTGILFPLARWIKLRGIYKDNLQSWKSLSQCNVLDGRDIYGKLVEAIFHKDETQSKPKPEYFDELFIQGQTAYDHISAGILQSYPGWQEAELRYPKKDTVTGEIVQAVGRGFKLDLSPDGTDYPLTDKYIKLRNADYELLGPSGLDIPSAAYISETAYNILVAGGNYPWQNGNKSRLAIRTELGVLRWIDCSHAIDLTSSTNWKLWGGRATLKVDHEGAWSRSIDPKLTLYILPTGNTRLEASELWGIFDAVKAESLNGNQDYERADGFTEEQLKGYKFLSFSPFYDYCTLIKKEDWFSYLAARPDRRSPLDLEAVQVANKLLKPNGTQRYERNSNTAYKMKAAASTRRDAAQEDDIMGGSATLIATSFKWDDPDKTIGKSTDERWPGTANMPAEWLHRSAYSWCGLTEASNSFSSQVPENLIFGSSECNSVMTRYKKSFQALFMKEDEFRNKYEPDTRNDFQGTISSYSAGFPVLGSSADSPFYTILKQFPENGPSNDSVDWTNWSKVAPWLCFSLGYQLRLDQASRILGAGQSWGAIFYPFQRGFYTVFESAVDLKLLDFLAAKRVTDEGLGKTEPTEDTREPKNEAVDDTAEPTEDDKLWAAVTNGQKQIIVDGVTLSNPVLMSVGKGKTETEIPATKVGLDENGEAIVLSEHQATPPSTTPNTPPEFVVKGDVTVFGLTIPVTFSTVKGSQSPGVTERITLPLSLTLGTLIPEFTGSLLDSIALTKTRLIYHSFSKGPSKPPGLRMHTDLVLSGALQPVSDVLQTVFGQTHPSLTVTGFLGTQRDWTTPLVPVGFILSGALLKMEVKLFGVVEITDIGVDLIASRAVKEDGTGLGYELGHAFWGGAGVMVLGSVVPMRVKWNLSVGPAGKHSMMMVMQDEAWTDVMGVKGLNVENVQFDVSWNKGDALGSLDLGILATLELRSGTIALKGEYSKEKWLLEGSLEDVDLIMIEEMYEDIFGTELSAINAEHDLTFKSMRLSVSQDGLVLDGEVIVNGYTSASATVSLTTAGVEIKGSVENVELKGVTIEDAALDVFIGTASSTTGRPFRVTISGTVKWGSFEITAGLYVDKISGKDAQWTVYGEFGEDLKLSRLAQDIAGTWLDIDIKQVAFVASSEEATTEQVPNKFKYPVKKGVYVWATVVDTVKAVNGVTKTQAGGLTLCAASSGEKLLIDINMPNDKAIALTKDITTGPVSFEIEVSDNPHVKVSAELYVKVANQTDPLHFQLSLEAGDTTAKGETVMMDGVMWQNPFGLSPQLQIGDLLLSIEIVYEEFLDTGVVEDVTFSGKVLIGPTEADVIIQFSEVPTEELIYGKVENLDLSSMFHLGKQGMQAMSAPPPEHNESLKFNDLLLYFSTGATVKGITYPSGVGFSCNMDLFNHNAKVSATIDEQITIKGTIDPFKIGPLTVQGFKDPCANVDIAIGPIENHIKIDGATTLCNVFAGINVNIEHSPKPVFKFTSTLAFGEQLTFNLGAEMDGEFSGTDTSSLDFILTAEMHDGIIKYIITEAQAHFIAANQAAQVGFAAKDAELALKEANLSADLDAAKKHLDEKKREWDAKHDAVDKAFNDKKAELDEEKVKKENDLKDAQKKLDDAIKAVEMELEQVKVDVAKKVQEADVAVETAAREAEAKLEGWKKNVAGKQAALDLAYGNVENCMNTAKKNLNNAQAAVNAKDTQINNLNQQIAHAGFFAKIPLRWDITEREVEKGVLEAALWIAEKAVEAGNACLNEAYTLAQRTLQGAQTALSEGEAGIAAEAQRLEAALAAAKNDAELLVKDAEAKLNSVKSSSVEKRLFETAKNALDSFINGLEDAMKDVQAAVDTIEKCAEYSAYTIAKDLLDTAQKNIKTLDPARLALNLAKGAEAGVNLVIEEAIKVAGNIFDVRTVILKGRLKALEDGTAPLEATVIAALAGKAEETFKVEYTPGGVEKFLEGLWTKVHEKL